MIDVQRQTGRRGNGQLRRLVVGEQSGHGFRGIRRLLDGIGEVIEYIRLVDPSRKRGLYGARSRATNVCTLNRIIIKDTLFHYMFNPVLYVSTRSFLVFFMSVTHIVSFGGLN